MTSFQIASDLHIEYKNDEVPDPLTLITPSSDILILAGDIGSLYKYDQLKTFLIKLCVHFKAVLYVPGNHEYYKIQGYNPCTMNTLFNKLKTIEKCIGNLYILNRTSVQINDVCIAGCTLWTKPEIKIPSFIVRVHGMNTEIYSKKYHEDLRYIENMVDYCKKKKYKLVVVTHHCPTYSVIKHYKKKKDKYISLYASNLDYLLTKENVHTWIAGHLHSNFDLITEGGTHLVGNQVGKPRDRITDYNKNMVINI